jgi:probable F420-dependent oxidoreductase
MKVGIFGVVSPRNVAPGEIAIEVERRGFEAFYNGEHYHLPTATPTPDFYKEIPDFYKYVPDPLQVFSLMAGVTKKLKFGTTILIVPIHDPMMLATRIATLDYLSNGRCIIGMGVGWNQEELANHGVEFATRQEKLREAVLAMKLMWGDKPASYNGTYVKFTECWSGPKPVQKPHPPLLLGGRPLKKNFRSIAEFCDGWIPTDTYAKTYGADIPRELETLNGMVREAGRDPKSLQHLMLLTETGLYDRDPLTFAKEAPTRDALAEYEKLGFARLAIGVPTFSREHFLGALDHAERVAAPWLEK